MSIHLEEMDFGDVTLAEVPVKISNVKYVLREASGDTATQWRNARTNAIKMVNGQVAGAANIASIDPFLVSLCLFDEAGVLVPLKKIQSWPDRVQKDLYERVKLISHLSEAGESIEALKEQQKLLAKQIEQRESLVKNSSETMEDGSD